MKPLKEHRSAPEEAVQGKNIFTLYYLLRQGGFKGIPPLKPLKEHRSAPEEVVLPGADSEFFSGAARPFGWCLLGGDPEFFSGAARPCGWC